MACELPFEKAEIEEKIPGWFFQLLHQIEGKIKEAFEKKAYRPGIVAYIEDEAGNMLWIESVNEKNAWHLPQGGIEQGEDIITALFREIYEETGLRPEMFKITGYAGTYDINAPVARAGTQPAIYKRQFLPGKRHFFFRLKCKGNKPQIILDSSTSSYRWVERGREQLEEMLQYLREERRRVLMEVFREWGIVCSY